MWKGWSHFVHVEAWIGLQQGCILLKAWMNWAAASWARVLLRPISISVLNEREARGTDLSYPRNIGQKWRKKGTNRSIFPSHIVLSRPSCNNSPHDSTKYLFSRGWALTPGANGIALGSGPMLHCTIPPSSFAMA